MNVNEFTDIIGRINKPDDPDKEYLVDILKKQLIESKRDKLVLRVKEAESNYLTGNVNEGSSDSLFAELENY